MAPALANNAAADREDAPVFFEGDWPYRTWRSLVMVVPGLGGAALFVGLLRTLRRGDVRDLRTGITFASLLLFAAAFAYGGLLMLWRFVRDSKLHIRVDGSGLSLGSTFVDWSRVGGFRVMQDAEGLYFSYRRRSRRNWGMDRPLMTQPRPDADTCTDVIRRLGDYLRTRQPHVSVG